MEWLWSGLVAIVVLVAASFAWAALTLLPPVRRYQQRQQEQRERQRKAQEQRLREEARKQRAREAAKRHRRPRISGLDRYSWAEMLEAADYRCVYCGRKFPRSALVREHDVPYARGGRHSRRNIVVACKHCNSLKGVMTGDEFREWLAQNRWARTWRLGKPKPRPPKPVS